MVVCGHHARGLQSDFVAIVMWPLAESAIGAGRPRGGRAEPFSVVEGFVRRGDAIVTSDPRDI